MISMRRLANGAALMALACAMSTAVCAQETTSAVRGQLTGSDGSLVSEATVTLQHVPSGTRSVVSPNSEGVFDARGLRVGGPYTVSVSAPGYESKTLSGINLAVGVLRLDFNLIAANAVDELVVTAARDPEADNSGVSSTMDRLSIESAVSVTRDIRDLAKHNLLAAANANADGGISIAGSNPKMNRITIDGASVQDDFGLNSGGLPTRRGPISLDAVEQLTVQAVPYDVENGDFQGGAIDIVLRSGGNKFHGSAFVNYLNDGMSGKKLKGVLAKPVITQRNYGGFLSGPILKDRLFFAISYEKYKSAEQVPIGPTGSGFGTSISGVTQATIDQVVGILNNTYATDFDAGSIPRSTPILDEKYSAKVDWNITDRHRASFTYRYALSELTSRTNLSNTSASLNSQWYLSGEEDYTYVGEVNSQWTDNLTTQIRATYRDYERRQNPPSGQEFGELQICSAAVANTTSLIQCEAPASLIRIGPDGFRQANELETHNLTFEAKAEYSLGPNLIKVGFDSQELKIVNLFVQNSDGVYYFDSIADFQAGRANRFIYNNAPSGDPFDAAANFKYRQNSVYLQDVLDITDDLQVSAGFRYDWYTSSDKPILNPNFVARNGFGNQTTYDGKSIVMPRFAFRYDPKSFFKVNGGFGLFSGGIPDVLISTSYSTTGFAAAGIQVDRLANGTFSELNLSPGFTQPIGATALNVAVADPRFGYDLPSSVTGLVTPSSIPSTSEVIALSPAFKLPASWKLFMSASVDLPWALKGTVDFVGTEVQNTIAYRDLKVRRLLVNGVQQLTPDGRIRYDGLNMTDAARAAAGVSGTNVQTALDLLATNEKRGHGYVIGFGLSREFLNRELYTSIGYVRQNLREGTSGLRFGTTSGSLYSSQLASAADPNTDAFGRGYEEVRDRVKFELGYKHEFIRGAPTRISLFGEARSGRPFNVTMNSPQGNRSPVFGANRSAYQLYVPDFASDPNPNDLSVGFVTFANQDTLNRFRAAVSKFNLPAGIVPKGFNRNPDINQLDLQVSQEIPAFFPGHKFKVVLDVQNVLNLLNNKWGVIEEYGSSGGSSSQGNNRIVDVVCANDAGVAVGAGSPVCTRYLYQSPSTTALTTTKFNDRSLWYMQVALRYEF